MQRHIRDNSILIINTGGTFNKIYNPLDGSLRVANRAIDEILSKWLCEFEVLNIIGKDSLDIDNNDREKLLTAIIENRYSSIVVVHGTDTIDISASFVAQAKLFKKIIFTASMTPFSIDPIEATANLAMAIGYLKAIDDDGVYIAINGVAGGYIDIIKDRENGRFIKRGEV
jgi:L-asparaginase